MKRIDEHPWQVYFAIFLVIATIFLFFGSVKVVDNIKYNKAAEAVSVAATTQDVVQEIEEISISSTAATTQEEAEAPQNVVQIQQEEHKIQVSPQPTPVKPFPSPAMNNHLTARGGVFQGPSGKETWYNLPMGGVINIMRDMGFSQQEYPYWIREDGCKMLGDYIMVSANLELRPRGTLVETSLGTGLVCDTGGFATYNQTQIDVATDWR